MKSTVVFCSLIVSGFVALACGASNTPTDDSQGSEESSSDLSMVGVGGSCSASSPCRGPLPMLCKVCGDGRSGCAHWSCVSGKCEVDYCGSPPPPPECTQASDCRGALPQVCMRCSNGTSECAHHACIAGKCETQICP